ncbi:MAG: hypothetical protein J6A52_07830 [Bacilli bacterium]|nr:hypothetical protein [Bacilli bacterium]
MADSIKFDYSEVDSTLNKFKSTNDTLNNSFISNKQIFELDDLIDLFNINYFNSLNTFVKNTYDENDKYITVGRSYYDELMEMNGSYNYTEDDQYNDNNNNGGPPTDTENVGDVDKTLTEAELTEIEEGAVPTIANINGGSNASGLSTTLKEIAEAVPVISGFTNATSEEQLNLLKALAAGEPINGIDLPPEAREFCLKYLESITGMSIDELLSGKNPEKLDAAIKSLAMALQVIQQASNLTPEELEIAMSGEAEEIAKLGNDDKTGLMILLLQLIKENGGIAGIYENPKLMEQLKDIAKIAESLNNVEDLTAAQKADVLKGLLGDNPTINGIEVPPELRDKILQQIQGATGLTLEQLLSGEYPKELEIAFGEMLGIIKLYGIFGSVSQEDMEKFMNHLLNGQYPEVCGISVITAKTMKDYLSAIAEANGITVEELLSDSKYADYLKQQLSNFAASQEEVANILMLDDNSLQEFLLGIYDGDNVTINGVAISENTANIIKVYLNNLATSLGISVETLLTDPMYKEILRKAMNDLNKYLSFVDLMTMMESEEIQTRLLQMVNGERAGLLGFTNENLTEFNKILEDFATTNNVTREDLLTNKELAQTTATLLSSTDIGKEISLLFPDYNDQQKQEVLNKIMISWNEDNENRIMNLFEYINNQNVETASENKTE